MMLRHDDGGDYDDGGGAGDHDRAHDVFPRPCRQVRAQHGAAVAWGLGRRLVAFAAAIGFIILPVSDRVLWHHLSTSRRHH
jgi:hypothetical protein